MSSGGDSRRTKRSSSRDRPSSHNKNHSRSQRQSRSRSNSRSSSSSSKSSPQSQRRRKSKGRSKSPNLRRIGNFTSSQDPRDVDSRVFIGNLNTSSLRSGEIEKLFLEYGVVTGVSLHKGFAFVQFTNRSCAEAAVKAYHGSIIAGSRVDCNLVNEGKMGDRHRSRASMDRDRGSRESSRLRDYDRYDAYDRPYERERRSRERSPLRPDPYDDRYRDPPPIRRGDRYPDDPFDRRDPYGRRDEYYRDRREGDRYLRDERDDPYRDPYRRDSYEYRDRDRDRERDRDGFERGRPTYHDYPEPVEPVQRPIDCEVIVVNRQQREYAESVERSLKQVGLVVDITYLGTDISLAQALDDVSRRGVLYAIIVTSQHALHRSVTLNILHGTPQEHRNMPLDDALSLIARNFERYMQNLREKTAASNLALAQVELSIPQLLCLLADGKQLTLDELTRVIAYLQERHKKLLETQPGASLSTTSALAPASSAAASTTTPTSDQGKTTAGQQAELQAKILSIFNPSGSTAATTSLANTVTNTLPSGGTLSSFNVQASVTPTEPVSSATTSLPSLMAQSIAPTNSFAQHQATAVSSAISNSTGSTVSGAMSVGNRAPVGGGPPGPSDSGPATSNVGINFDNPSVQKALDNLIQSGPNLLKNLGQVGQIVQGVSGGQSLRGKTLLSTPPSGNDGGIGFDNMHGGGGVGRGAVPLQSSMGGGIMSGGRGGPMIGGVGMGGPGRGMGGGDIGMGGPGRGMGGGDIGMGGMPRGPPGMQRGGFARGRGGRY